MPDAIDITQAGQRRTELVRETESEAVEAGRNGSVTPISEVVAQDHNLDEKLSDLQPEVRTAIAAYVQRVATDYADEVLSITLYGSQARGEAGAESDIDLFIVVRCDAPAVREALIDLAWQVQFEHDVVISDIIRTVDQLRHMQARRFPYYRSIEREGIVLWTSASEPTLDYA
jgi:predicted nucleotidyltransferase